MDRRHVRKQGQSQARFSIVETTAETMANNRMIEPRAALAFHWQQEILNVATVVHYVSIYIEGLLKH